MPEPVSPADTPDDLAEKLRSRVRAGFPHTHGLVNSFDPECSPDRYCARCDFDATLAALLAVGERDKAEIEALTAAVEGLLDVGTRSRSGDPSLDPEEWYAIRDYATNALKDGIGVVDDIRDARERDRRQIARLTEALERIAGVPSGAWVHQGRDAVDTLKSWARAVLADEEDAPQVPQFGGGVLPPPIGPNTLAAGEEDADNG